MRARARILLIAAAVLAAYVGASWLIGIQVQRQLERSEQRVLTDTPYVVLLHREYHRGIFAASERVTFGLRGPFAGFARVLPVAQGGTALEFTVRNTIRHGPLPGLRAIALATIDTELILPSELAQRLSAAAGGGSVLAIRTRLGWTGAASTRISSPAFRTPLQGGAELSSSGFSASFETTRDQATWTGRGASAGFSVVGPRGRAAFGGIRFDADRKRVAGPLYVGAIHFGIAGIQFQANRNPPVLINGLRVTATSEASGGSDAGGGYIDSGADFSADSVQGAGFTFSHVEYAFRFGHLQTTALVSLTQALRTAQSNTASGNPALMAAAVRDAFIRYGTELLIHDPVVEIPRIGFAMPEGTLRLQARLAAHGIRRPDLSAGVGVVTLANHLDGAAKLRIDAALLTRLIGTTPRGPALSAQIDALQRQGYLKRDGAAWTAQIAYRAGRLTINGLAYPPAVPPS